MGNHYRVPKAGGAGGLSSGHYPPDGGAGEVGPLRCVYAAGGLPGEPLSGPDPAGPMDEGL